MQIRGNQAQHSVPRYPSPALMPVSSRRPARFHSRLRGHRDDPVESAPGSRAVGRAPHDYPPRGNGRQGDAIYRDQILPEIEPPPKGTFVVIDIESGDYEIDERDLTATLRLLKRRPAAMTYAVRVGYRAPYRHTGILPTPTHRA